MKSAQSAAPLPIRKLRRTIVLALMCVELAFVVSILTGLYLNARSGYIRISSAALHQAARWGDYPQIPQPRAEERPARRDPDAAGTDAVPFAVLTGDAQGNITVAENQIDVLSTQELLACYERVLALQKEDGLLRDKQLRYLYLHLPDGSARVVFASTVLEQTLLRNQLLLSVGILLLSSAAFFLVSCLLSRVLVRPVADAFKRERQFVADASHELKTPLTVVLSNTEMLLSSGDVADERSLRRLDNIRAESQRMRTLVEDLLALARLDAGRRISAPAPQCFSYIAACALSGFEPALFDAGRTLEEDVAPSLYVNGDAARLRELLDILLDNACKYSQPGSAIRVTLHAVRREAVLCVTSEGNPIPASEHAAIFRRFYRLDPSRGQQPGYGLGLSIAQGIVADHHGRIGVRNDTPQSNTFFIHLPLCAAPESSAENG